MEYNPFLKKNKNTKKEYLYGKLLVAVDGAITELMFKYGVTVDRKYTTQFSAGIPTDYVSVTQQIYTSRVDLPFAQGSKVRLHNDEIMNIESIDPAYNENNGIQTGLYINLNGGGQ